MRCRAALVLASVAFLGTPSATAQRPAAPDDHVEALVSAALDAAAPDSARAIAERAHALAERLGDARGEARARYALAFAAYTQGEGRTDTLFSAAVRAARRAGDARTEGVALAWQGIAIGTDDRTRALDLIRQGVAVHEQMPGDDGRRALLVSLNLLANQYEYFGRTAEAAELHRRILREARPLDDWTSVGLSALTLGDLAVREGDYIAAVAHYGESEEAAAASVAADLPGHWRTDVEAGRAKIDAALGRVDEAAATLRRLADAEVRNGAMGYASGFLKTLGTVYRDAGRTDDAVAAYRGAYRALEASPYATYRFEMEVLEAAALFDVGRDAEARRVLRPAADSVAANPPYPESHALALTLLAREARAAGRHAEAARFAREAIEVAEGSRLPREARDAYAELAEALEASGDASGALGAFRRSAALSDSLRSTEQAREVGRLQAEAAFDAERRAEADRRRRLTRGLGGLAALGLLAALGGAAYARTVRRKNGQIERQRAELADANDALAAANADLAQTNAVVREARDAQARFFQMASHELRTPLTLTVGPLDDVLRGRHGDLPREARHALDLALANTDRLHRLVDDLLDAARLDVGQVPHRPARADLGAIVAETVGRFQSHAEREGVALAATLPDGVVSAVIDAVSVEKALSNLIANALRHTPRGGSVTVTLAADADEARVAVADSGPGIAPDALPHLFERFYRADERAGVGSGLGLSLVREWMDRHGGRVEVESEPGQGATFTLAVPAGGPAEPVEPPGAPGSVAPGESASPDDPETLPDDALIVLVAEDHPELRAYVADHIRRGLGLGEHVRVVEAADGETALALARETVPDLVVSDVMMPTLGGYGLTRALKEDEMTSHVPVLLLTARADTPGTVEGFESGADGYLTKPFDPDVLRAQASALVAERRRLRDRFAADPAGPARGDGARLSDRGVGEASPSADPPRSGGVGTGDSNDGAAGGRSGVEPEPPALSALDRQFLDRVDTAIAEGLGDAQFGAEALGVALGLSSRQVLRKLKAIAGDTPLARLRRARVDAAERLLDAGSSLVDAAAAVGYADARGLRRALATVRGGRKTEPV